jgi:hypothetical protein
MPLLLSGTYIPPKKSGAAIRDGAGMVVMVVILMI